MKRLALVLLAATLLAQRRNNDPLGDTRDPVDIKLPSGKSQRDEINKADHKRNQVDALKMSTLADEADRDLQQSEHGTAKTGKQLEEIEKLARKIRGRLTRN